MADYSVLVAPVRYALGFVALKVLERLADPKLEQLMYVGATRARQHLVVITDGKPDNGAVDELDPAIRDLVTGGEDEEWQDFMSPSERQPVHGTPMADQSAIDTVGELTDRELLIERLPHLEQAAGIELGGLHAVVSDFGDGGQLQVQVNGELSARGDDQQLDGLTVVAVVYDSAGRVLGTLEQYYFDAFPGWDAFSMMDFVSGSPAKVRVFVRSGA